MAAAMTELQIKVCWESVMSLSHRIQGSESARLYEIAAHWPWRITFLLGGAAALALFAASHPLIFQWALLILLCSLFIAGAVEGPEDVRRTGTRGR